MGHLVAGGIGMKRMVAVALSVTLASGGVLGVAGCERKGPAERAGEKIDRAAEETKDKLDPAGPAEKAGKKVDRAVDDLTK
jgi:hypothetical protein